MPLIRFVENLRVRLNELSVDPVEAGEQLVNRICIEIRDMLALDLIEKARAQGNALKIKIEIDTDWKKSQVEESQEGEASDATAQEGLGG